VPDPDGVGFGLDFLGMVPVYPVDWRVTGVDLVGGVAAAAAAVDFHMVTVNFISYLNSTFLDRRDERMPMPMSQVVTTVSKKQIPSHVRALVFEIW
jgi:hypothetical protein